VSTSPVYLLDADVLITAKNRYYSFKICPGFWESLLHHHSREVVYSIDKVKQELLPSNKKSKEDLVKWIKQYVPKAFFLSCNRDEVIEAYRKVIHWSTGCPRYEDTAKADFAKGADGWLVAYASATGHIVVTQETSRPDSRSTIKLPDVCKAFRVKYKDTFAMLHELDVSYCFQPNCKPLDAGSPGEC